MPGTGKSLGRISRALEGVTFMGNARAASYASGLGTKTLSIQRLFC